MVEWRLLVGIVFLGVVSGEDARGMDVEFKVQKKLSQDETILEFTNNHQSGVQLSTDNSNNAATFTNGEIKLIFHGYGDGMSNPKVMQLKDAYLKTEKYSNINIIHVNYEKLAENGCYWTLVGSLSIIGKCTAELIKNKLINNNIDIDRLHPIGFGFGAHAAAVTAENLRGSGIFRRLTGIEPSLALFTFPFPGSWQKLNRKHAKFVDVIHTNSGWRGVYSSNAHFDFYGNNGMQQPGCGWSDMKCSHTRGLDVYIESVISPIGFYAVKCGLLSTIFGRCKFEASAKKQPVIVGEPCSPPDKSAEGSYFFPTRDVFPYAVGMPQPTTAAKQPTTAAKQPN